MAIKKADTLNNNKVHRYDEISLPVEASLLPSEVPVALSYDGITHVVMMATPACAEDLALGFTLSENLVSSAAHIQDISLSMRPNGLLVDVQLHKGNLLQLKQLRKNIQGRSGLGLKGNEALAAIAPDLRALTKSAPPPPIHFYKIRDRISQLQKNNAVIDPLHSAMLVNNTGNIELYREDISRQNALDKVFGAAIRQRFDLKSSCALTTSRCCIELVQKTIQMGIPSLATLGPPSSMAVKTARKHNLSLIYLSEGDDPCLYSSGG